MRIFIVVLAISAGFALSTPTWATTPALLTVEEMASTIRLIPLGQSKPPAGISLIWPSAGGEMAVGISNGSEGVIELDWNRSAFVNVAGRTTGIVPGSTRRGDVGQAVPGAVVPPGAKLQEAVVRKDAIGELLKPVEPLVGAPDVGGEVSLTLCLKVGGQDVFVTERFKVEQDAEILARVNAAATKRTAREDAQRQLVSLRPALAEIEAERARKRTGALGWKATGALLMVGGVAGAAGGIASGEDSVGANIGAGAFMVGLGAGSWVIGGKKSKKVESLERRADALEAKIREAEAVP